MPFVALWFYAFLLTLAIELPVGFFVLREQDVAKRLTLVALANLLSHPTVWFVFPEVGAELGLDYRASLIVSEVWAYSMEAFFYVFFLGASRFRQCLWLAVLANTASLTLGLVLAKADYL